MKKILFATSVLLLLSMQVMAQKYFDIYQNGKVVTSIASNGLDSVGVTGSTMQDRKVNFYRNGKSVNSYLVSSVDSIKIFRTDEEQLVYMGIVGFNQELYEKPIDVLAMSTSGFYTSYVNELTRKDGTLLYYAVDHALDMLKDASFPTPLTSVNLVTFTDGLDQGSLMMNSNYSTDEQYLEAVNKRIRNTTVKGLPVTAYSLGLRGSDVSDYDLFQKNLNKLASTPEKAFEVSSMGAVRTRLQEICDQIISISNRQTFSLKIPGQSNGTLIRFTFDGNSAENSTLYIEGTFNLSNRSLTNVTYHGIKATSGSFVQGTQDGIFVTFTFTGMQREDGNGLIPKDYVREYYKASVSSTWQQNSEFTPNNNTQTTVTHSGAVIMLVLDCSNSLGSQFSDMRSYAQDFINRVAENTQEFKVDAPKNPTATLTNDFNIMVSWDAVKHAESYEVYRSSSPSRNFSKVASGITTTSWIDSTPLSEKNYYYIRALGHGLTSSASNVTDFVEITLSAPTNVSASLTNNLEVKISWNAVNHAEYYIVYRNSSGNGTYNKVSPNMTSTTWIDTEPLDGMNYYLVAAYGHGMEAYDLESVVSVNCKLDAPKNVKAYIPDNDFVIKVSWDVVNYAESYNIYRSSSSLSGFTKVATGAGATTWTDKSPLAGSNYYRVSALGRGLTSPISTTSNVVNYSLDAPSNVMATLTDDFVIKVSWNIVKYADSYDIYCSSSSSGNYTKVASGVKNTTWIDNTPLSGSNYYRVCALGHGLTSPSSTASNVVNYALNAPTNVTASILDNDFVICVKWDAVNHAESYIVYRSSSASSGFTKVASDVKTTTWTDRNPLAGINYYRIYAVGHGLVSDASKTSNVVEYVLDAPSNVKASIPDDDFVVQVTWNSVNHAESYNVYRSSSASSGFTNVASDVTTTTWTDRNPLAGTNYYRIYAVGHGLVSDASKSSNVVEYVLNPPSNVSAFIPDDDFVIQVNWDSANYAESYDVYRSGDVTSGFTRVATNITRTTWTDMNPLTGKNYYRICAIGYGMNSSFSITSNGVDYVLAAPSNVKARLYDECFIQVSWDAVKYADSYNIYRCSYSTGDFVRVASNIVSTSWIDEKPLACGNYYRVCSVSHDQTSPASEASNEVAFGFVIVNGVKINMVKVIGGTFKMGATSEQGNDYDENELPVHQVTLPDYYICETEVTQELWKAVMGKNYSGSGKLPVSWVGWEDCQEFISKLNALTGQQFRLPTEAEWEFAARGGTKSRGYKFSGSNNIDEVAWYDSNSNSLTHEVGTKSPNELGIYDMSGNVIEWCQDWYGSYGSSSQTNPMGPSSGSNRVQRGGSFETQKKYCRVSFRGYCPPMSWGASFGVRLAH